MYYLVNNSWDVVGNILMKIITGKKDVHQQLCATQFFPSLYETLLLSIIYLIYVQRNITAWQSIKMHHNKSRQPLNN